MRPTCTRYKQQHTRGEQRLPRLPGHLDGNLQRIQATAAGILTRAHLKFCGGALSEQHAVVHCSRGSRAALTCGSLPAWQDSTCPCKLHIELTFEGLSIHSDLLRLVVCEHPPAWTTGHVTACAVGCVYGSEPLPRGLPGLTLSRCYATEVVLGRLDLCTVKCVPEPQWLGFSEK